MEGKRFYEAVDVYTNALKIQPSNNSFVLTLLHDRAFANSNIGNFREAIDDCTKALAINASHVNVRSLRAQCYHYVEEFEASINDYELAQSAAELQNDSENLSKLRVNLANVKAEMNRKLAEAKNADGNEQFNLNNYHSAEKYFSEAIAFWPNNLNFYKNRCNCLIKQGQLNRALLDCQQMIKIDPNYAMGYELQAKCYLICGDYDSAERAAKKLEKFKSHLSKELKVLSTKLLEHEEMATLHFNNKKFSCAGKISKNSRHLK